MIIENDKPWNTHVKVVHSEVPPFLAATGSVLYGLRHCRKFAPAGITANIKCHITIDGMSCDHMVVYVHRNRKAYFSVLAGVQT